jgi:hypothetical protein
MSGIIEGLSFFGDADKGRVEGRPARPWQKISIQFENADLPAPRRLLLLFAL